MSPPSTPIRFLLSPSLGEVKEHVRAELFGRALSQRLGRPVVVEIAPSYEVLERELAEGRVELVWGTAEQCTAHETRARAVLRAVRAGRWYYHAALLCRADAPLTLQTLAGTRAAWVAPRSTGGYLLPTRHLLEHGCVPSQTFSEERFHGTYRKALLAVLEHRADVTAIYSSHPEENTVRAYVAEHVGGDERLLVPFSFTAATLSDGLILTSRLPEADAAALVSILTSLADAAGGLEPVLGLYDSEGFVLSSTPVPPHAPDRAPAHHPEYFAVELDARERCMRVWTPMGRAFGQDVRQAEGQHLVRALGSAAGDALVALSRAARHSGVGGRVEYRLEVEGETRWYAAEATVRPPEPGGPATTLLVRDITELRALEDELYRLASFPLLHPEPLLELGPDGTLRYANPSAHTAFPDLLLRGRGHPLVDTALTWARRAAPDNAPALVELGGQHWELLVAPLVDPEGLRVFAQNITARKQMEAQLFRADRLAALGSLAAAVGHEMNNPLAFMMANLGFAREELARMGETLGTHAPALAGELTDVVEALVEALEGAERLKTIVQDLRLLASAPPAHRAPVELIPVLEHALSLVRGELRHRARLEKDFQPVPRVEAQEARLGQVFVNLLLNALQAMTEQDAARNVLRVATSTGPKGEAVVEVRDTGVGMPPEVLARLFEPFFTTRATGTGLGLSVSHAIVTSLGGSLRADSREGLGTTLTVVLPAAHDEPEPHEPA